jgi:hypothetical protein
MSTLAILEKIMLSSQINANESDPHPVLVEQMSRCYTPDGKKI